MNTCCKITIDVWSDMRGLPRGGFTLFVCVAIVLCRSWSVHLEGIDVRTHGVLRQR